MDIKQMESNHITPFHVPQKETGDIRNLPDVNLLIVGGHEIILEGCVFSIGPQLLWCHEGPVELPVATLYKCPSVVVHQGQGVQGVCHNAEVTC